MKLFNSLILILCMCTSLASEVLAMSGTCAAMIGGISAPGTSNAHDCCQKKCDCSLRALPSEKPAVLAGAVSVGYPDVATELFSYSVALTIEASDVEPLYLARAESPPGEKLYDLLSTYRV